MIVSERNNGVVDKRERTIWIMNLLHNGKSNYEFCKERNIVGFGWGLLEHTTTDYEEFKELIKIEGKYYQDGKYDYALQCALNAFDVMESGDIILLHDEKMRFYMCVVSDEHVKINQGALYFEANVTCNRKVKFLTEVISAEELRNWGVEPSSCIARHTIEKMSLSNKEQMENYINNYILYV